MLALPSDALAVSKREQQLEFRREQFVVVVQTLSEQRIRFS